MSSATVPIPEHLTIHLASKDHPERVWQSILDAGAAGDFYGYLEKSARRAFALAKTDDEVDLLRWVWFEEGRMADTARERLNLRKRWWRYQRALGHLRSGDRVLDAGCGAGTDCLLFAALRGVRAEGVDVHEKRLALANMRRDGWRHILFGGEERVAPFRPMNVLRLEFPDGAFDAVWCNQAIEHIQPPEAFLAEAWRVLRPGGMLFIANINGLSPYAHLKALRDRKGKPPVERRRDARTGETYEYANELLRNPRRLARLAAEAGFRHSELAYCGALPSPLALGEAAARAIFAVDQAFSRTPLAIVLCNDFVLTVRKT